MKKHILTILVLTLLSTISGCKNNANLSVEVSANTSAKKSAIEITSGTQIPMTSEKELKFEPVTLIDNDACIFTVTDIKPDGAFGYTLKVQIENKTNKTAMFSLDNTSINDYLIDPLWAAEVGASEKKTTEISWLNNSLEKAGIDEIKVIHFILKAYDVNDLLSDYLVDEELTLYPLNDTAETLALENREPTSNEIVMYENGDCSFIITGYTPNDVLGYSMNVFIENKTDKTLMFSIETATINGQAMDPYWASKVFPGKMKCCEVSWAFDLLEENSITNIEEIEFSLRVYDIDNFMEGNIITKTFTVNP